MLNPQWINLTEHAFMDYINTLRPRQNGRHFPAAIFKCIFCNENKGISIKTSLKFFPEGPINNSPSLVQIMAWRRQGDKPLSKPMTVKLSTHICITRPQWVNQWRWCNHNCITHQNCMHIYGVCERMILTTTRQRKYVWAKFRQSPQYVHSSYMIQCTDGRFSKNNHSSFLSWASLNAALLLN